MQYILAIVSEIYDRSYNPDTIVIVNSEILSCYSLLHYCQNAIYKIKCYCQTW